ncbi:MAG: PDZ domain-containing protein [Phycisphaerales bacterium]|nr:PDZ domain-containing protein [Phycisphaerales bacterium]
MKTWALTVMLAAGASLAVGPAAPVGEEQQTTQVWVTKTADGEAEVVVNGEVVESGDGVFVMAGGENCGETQRIVARRVARGTSEAGQPRVIVRQLAPGDRQPLSLVSGTVDPNDGWLGVQIAMTVTNENDVESTNVIIQNVAKGSPAETAGFAQGDQVVEINDAAVDGMESLTGAIRDAGVGSRMKFTVMRDGARHTLVATLASRGDLASTEWIHESVPNAMLNDQVRHRIHMLRKGENGEWVVGDGDGDVDIDFDVDLPDDILHALPDSEDRTFQVFVGDGGTSINTVIRRNDGDSSVEIKRDGEEAITVTRGTDGEETTVTYANEDELKTGDPGAYEMLEESTANVVVNLDGLHGGDGANAFVFELDGAAMGDHLKEALEAHKIEIQGLDGASGNLGEHLAALSNLKDGTVANAIQWHSRARRSIHENADGSIDVTVRKGGDELVTHYSDADDLAARDADAYAKYLELTEEAPE